MISDFRFDGKIIEDRSRNLEHKISKVLTSYQIPDKIKTNVAVDIGCNLGGFPIAYTNTFKEIYFFEAFYDCYQQTIENLKQHNVRNSVGFNLAVYKETGKIVDIKMHENRDNGSSSVIDHQDWTDVSHKVMTISLEDIFTLCKIDRINYLKMDCEGSEFEILMNHDLSRIDCIAIEVHRQRDDKNKELTDYLKAYFEVLNYHDGYKAHDEYLLINKDIAQ